MEEITGLPRYQLQANTKYSMASFPCRARIAPAEVAESSISQPEFGMLRRARFYVGPTHAIQFHVQSSDCLRALRIGKKLRLVGRGRLRQGFNLQIDQPADFLPNRGGWVQDHWFLRGRIVADPRNGGYSKGQLEENSGSAVPIWA